MLVVRNCKVKSYKQKVFFIEVFGITAARILVVGLLGFLDLPAAVGNKLCFCPTIEICKNYRPISLHSAFYDRSLLETVCRKWIDIKFLWGLQQLGSANIFVLHRESKKRDTRPILAPLSGLLHLRIELVSRCAGFIVKCLNSSNQVAKSVARYRECIHLLVVMLSIVPLFWCLSIELQKLTKRRHGLCVWSMVDCMVELLCIRHSYVNLECFNSEDIDFMIEFMCIPIRPSSFIGRCVFILFFVYFVRYSFS